MAPVNPELFEYAMAKIRDGHIFENVMCQFLSQVLGYTFVPVGGVKDRGIDGLEHLFNRQSYDTNIYQMSIQEDSHAKIRNSLSKLRTNKNKFDAFYFVTNQRFKEIDVITDQLYSEYRKPVHIYDIKWLSSHVNDSPGTINVYEIFVRTYLHEYDQPGKGYAVSDFLTDPRLYVFLRQQWDTNRGELDLHLILADTLILYCLEGTDPDKNLFKTADQIKADIARLVAFDFRALQAQIDERLRVLSTKPRQINFHYEAKAYCLPYDTRLRISERNLQDAYLYEQFRTQTEEDLQMQLNAAKIKAADAFGLVEKTINRVFYQQGLEFADFVAFRQDKNVFEKDLYEIVSFVVDASAIKPADKEQVKFAVSLAIRKMVYDGTEQQNRFLMKLSHTYMMMFMLQCDPKLCLYFQSMASKLNVYVCTSIIIPALSEFYLPEVNRRHWNLLKSSSDAGVTLVVNEPIVNELASHFHYISKKYAELYENYEDIYLADEEQIRYVDEIMIRAYFYAKSQGKVKRFRDFINNFVSPSETNPQKIATELIEWLKEEFHIQFKSDVSAGIKLDTLEEDSLYIALKRQKTADPKARTDARLILTIHKIRELNNETNASGIFGYRTWWLSKDTVTQRVVKDVFGDKYGIGCYMRPDFLYDYISLAPSRNQIDSAYKQLFPTMLGVNISFHLDPEVMETIHVLILEHKDKNHARIASILRSLSEQLRTQPRNNNKGFVRSYFEAGIKD